MRILYFSRDYTTHDRRFLEAIVARHETFFLRLEHDGIRYEPRGLPGGVAPLAWPSGEGKTSGALSTILDRLRPDVVHAGPVPTCAALAASTGYGRLLAMSWGSDVLVDAHQSAAQTEQASRALAACDLVLCDCDAVRRACQALAPIEDDRVVQIPWGLELALYPDVAPRPSHGEEFRIVSTRTWSEIYGIDTVLAAFAWAHARLPTLRLRLIGDGPLAAQIQTQIEALSLGEVVERPGRLDQNALRSELLAADLYVSASRSDGTSISLLEAMAARLPVVATNVGGNPEWVVPGETGWLVPADDVEALGAALIAAATSAECARLGAAARAIVERRADWARNVDQLHAAYERVARGGSP